MRVLTTGHPRPVIDFTGCGCKVVKLWDYYETFEQGVIEELPPYPALQSASDKTTIT